MGNDNYPLAFFVWILLDNADKENTIVFAGPFNSLLILLPRRSTDRHQRIDELDHVFSTAAKVLTILLKAAKLGKIQTNVVQSLNERLDRYWSQAYTNMLVRSKKSVLFSCLRN